MSLVFLDKIPISERGAFEAKVIQISRALRINPNWLMIVMYSESGLNPQAYNPIPPYPVGLIQFAQGTAYGLGTSPEDLRQMSRIQQLDYVWKYFSPKAGKFKSIYDLYLYNFLPSSVGYGDSHIVGSEISMAYARSVGSSNQGFDLNKNGLVTIGEFKQFINQRYGKYIKNQAYQNQNTNLIFNIILVLIAFQNELGLEIL
jgi:hypothetical protein